MGRVSGVRDWIVFSRSSTAIWYVSRSASLEIEVRIFCFCSTMAWNEVRELELELELEDDLAVAFDDLAGLVGFAAEADDEGVLILRMLMREEMN